MKLPLLSSEVRISKRKILMKKTEKKHAFDQEKSRNQEIKVRKHAFDQRKQA